MNVDQFEYNRSPFTKVKKYEVMTLSEKGVNKYFNKESYTYRYLPKLSPQREKDIFRRFDFISENENENEKELKINFPQIKEKA